MEGVQMKKMVLAASLLAAIVLAAPRYAPAQIGIGIEKPGLSLHAGPPAPPVVVVPPAVVYSPPAYYVERPPKHYWKHWHHWNKHRWHHHHDD